MASGRYTHEKSQHLPLEKGIAKQIPARATRDLSATQESMRGDSYNALETRLVGPLSRSSPKPARPGAMQKKVLPPRPRVAAITPPWYSAILFRRWDRATSDYSKTSGYRSKAWAWVLCLIGVIFFLAVLLSAGMLQRSVSSYISNDGQVYDMQVGGNEADSWQHDPQTKVVPQSGPYTVLGNPSINVDFINKVLSTYKSPAAGKGQTLHDLGAQYGVDPAFALAFFMHESSFGTQGEARKSLSLGNLRCIPNFRCEDNFAQFDTWEDGFKAWYQLIRNLYVAQWGLTTVDQIIPRYAPSADNNNEQGYIAALKHALDTWHAGQIVVR
jgi:hypothetical protein